MKKTYTKPNAEYLCFVPEQGVCSNCGLKVANAVDLNQCHLIDDWEGFGDMINFSDDNTCAPSDFYCYFTAEDGYNIFGS